MSSTADGHISIEQTRAEIHALLARLDETSAFGVATLDNVGALCADHGVEAAQRAIVEFCSRAREFVRDNDTSLILSDTRVYFALKDLVDGNHLLLAALKLERLFNDPLIIDDAALHLDVHAGFVFCSEEVLNAGEDRSQLYSFVERARESAIANGEAFDVKSSDELLDVEAVPSVNQALLRAIDTHDLTMDYQPKYRLSDGALTGAEALVRWRRDGMIIPPDEFLPLLSDEALWNMTQHCLRCVVRDSLDFPSSVPLSLNVHPICLNDNLLALIKDELALWNVNAGRLMIEVTEAGVFAHQAEAFAMLQRLHELGVGISIDEFGAGDSSMDKFSQLPADEIKLDRRFVQNIVNDDANQKITDTLIELCHRFSKTVVAEGIEDGETVAYLIDAGCNAGQGFYLGAPMSKDRFRMLVS